MSYIDPNSLKTRLIATYDYVFGPHSVLLIKTAIKTRVEKQGGMAPFQCAIGVSNALGVVCGAQSSRFPGLLNN